MSMNKSPCRESYKDGIYEHNIEIAIDNNKEKTMEEQKEELEKIIQEKGYEIVKEIKH